MLEVHNWFEQGLGAAIAARVGCEMPDPSQIATAEGVALHSLTPALPLLEHYVACVQPSRPAERIRSLAAARYTILYAAWVATLFRLRQLLR
jgi:hypothetical protein